MARSTYIGEIDDGSLGIRGNEVQMQFGTIVYFKRAVSDPFQTLVQSAGQAGRRSNKIAIRSILDRIAKDRDRTG